MYTTFKYQLDNGNYSFSKEMFNNHFSRYNLFDVSEDNLEHFLELFILPISKNKLKELKLFNDIVFKNEDDCKQLNQEEFASYKTKIIDNFSKIKEDFCNKVTTFGYKYFDAHSNIYGNLEYVTDYNYQDFDIIDNKIYNYFFIVKQFKLNGKKTSIYQEIANFKSNNNYNHKLKTIFEKKYFLYEDLNINKKLESRPRSNVYVPDGDSYKTVFPVPSIAQILMFNDLFGEIFYYKKEEMNIGGANPQNVGFFCSMSSGVFNSYKNNLFVNKNTNKSVYKIKYSLIADNSVKDFNERRTYKRINHLNIIETNYKTDNKLMEEINFILDNALSTIYLTIDYQNKYGEKDPLSISDSENYKLIKNLLEEKPNSIELFKEKLEKDFYNKFKNNKKIKLYNKRTNFFNNLIRLGLERVLNYKPNNYIDNLNVNKNSYEYNSKNIKKSSSVFLVLKDINVFDATANSNIFTTGFPALTNFVGLSEFIKYKINENFPNLVNENSVSIVINEQFYNQKHKNVDRRTHVKYIMAQKVGGLPEPGKINAATVDERTVQLNLNLIFKLSVNSEYYIDDDERKTYETLEIFLNNLILEMKVGGGKMFLNNHTPFLTKDINRVLHSLEDKKDSYIIEKGVLDFENLSNFERRNILNGNLSIEQPIGKYFLLQTGYKYICNSKDFTRDGKMGTIANPIFDFVRLRKVASYLYNNNYNDILCFFKSNSQTTQYNILAETI